MKSYSPSNNSFKKIKGLKLRALNLLIEHLSEYHLAYPSKDNKNDDSSEQTARENKSDCTEKIGEYKNRQSDQKDNTK